MTDLLRRDQLVSSRSGQSCRVIELLGSGGQGEVYRVQWGSGEYALKWYYDHSATAAQRGGLETLIDQGAPSELFLWPEDIAEADGVPGFGYIMRLRPTEYRGLHDFVSGKVDASFFSLATAGIGLAKAFRSLHNHGLCYRDISFGNAFVNPATGAVLVCDNDNVTVNRSNSAGVLGTPDFMAPEIVRMEALPSTRTDLYSLAVLLFYILFIGHPLVGRRVLAIRCWDTAAREYMFGEQPLFIFDTNDMSNGPVDMADDPSGEAGGFALIYWALYPEFLRTTFRKAFSIGLREPDARVTELEWLHTLTALRDAIFRCSSCGTPNFYDAEAMKAAGSRLRPCWSCAKTPVAPFRLAIGNRLTMLNSGSQLYPHHLDEGHAYDFSRPVAEVVHHPSQPGVWGLKNLGRVKWVAMPSGGGLRDVESGRSVVLATNTRINFGKAEGTIVF
jgi:DNA-binding helix-hairpin-helix protein with protein kinase domain